MTEICKAEEKQENSYLQQQFDYHLDRITKLQQLLGSEEQRLFELIDEQIKKTGKIPTLTNLIDFEK